jgi:hypothetical protein
MSHRTQTGTYPAHPVARRSRSPMRFPSLVQERDSYRLDRLDQVERPVSTHLAPPVRSLVGTASSPAPGGRYRRTGQRVGPNRPGGVGAAAGPESGPRAGVKRALTPAGQGGSGRMT